MPINFGIVDRLRIERAVWTLDQRLYDLPRRSRVGATEVRRIQVPVLDGDPAESQTEGVVEDPDHRLVHIAMEDGLGILTYDAEPDLLEPDVEGLAIYTVRRGQGNLIASSQG